SRSATIIIGYLMDKFHLTVAEAFEITHHQRPAIFPNHGFMKQLFLKEFQLIDQFGEEDQELSKFPRNVNNLQMAAQIGLGKRLRPLIRIQDFSKLPNSSKKQIIKLQLYSFSFKTAEEEWEQRKQGKDEEEKKTQDG
ncbi:MAG: hypothetical protein EZS28_050076, partial [Streblomastix strix]